jgi:competence protein ComEA
MKKERLAILILVFLAFGFTMFIAGYFVGQKRVGVTVLTDNNSVNSEQISNIRDGSLDAGTPEPLPVPEVTETPEVTPSATSAAPAASAEPTVEASAEPVVEVGEFTEPSETPVETPKPTLPPKPVETYAVYTPKPIPQGQININTATLEELQTLPGIGPAYAERIIEYRNTLGGFRTIADLLDVKGIGEKTFEKLEPYVYCE